MERFGEPDINSVCNWVLHSAYATARDGRNVGRSTYFFSMRFLHTSDWHLGRSLHQQDLHGFQEAVLTDILTLAERENVDVVIVAGDIFDRAVPPVESVSLFTETIRRLAETCTVVVTSGNHDSAIRLGYGSQLFRPGIHIATDTDSAGTGVDVRVANETVRIYPIPYLVPDHARTVLKVTDEPLERSHQAVLEAAAQRIRDDLDSLTDPPDATVVIAHAFVTGGSTSESERDISVGGIDSVSADVFRGFNYVALGHLHGPQTVQSPDGTVIRYSGSPLRYSFSEARQSKSVTLFDIGAGGVTNIQVIDIAQPRDMAVLTGKLAELTTEPNIERYADAWVQVIVTDDARPTDLVQTVREAFPHALSILHRPENAATGIGGDSAAMTALTPVEISERFIESVTHRDPTDAERELLRDVYERARSEVDA